MVYDHHADEPGKDEHTRSVDEKDEHTAAEDVHTGDSENESDGEDGIDRRSVLKAAGVTAAAGAIGAGKAIGTASADVDVTEQSDYEVWTVTGKEVYDLSDGEVLSNILVDQTADGACLTIRSRNKSGWEVRNVGFLGVGREGDGGNRFQFQVSTPAGEQGLIENIWANGKARNGTDASKLGGIYIRSSHAGHIDIRHTYIEGFGNNAVYASAVGKDGGDDGSVRIENSYHRDNTVSQFRIGSPDSVVRNCVGVIDDPDGERGAYPGNGTYNTRGIWGKHFRNQRIENSAFYVSEDDYNYDGAFEARYIEDRSHGPEAVVESVDCHVNADAPILTGSTSNARVEFTNLGESPTVNVINEGVPTSPEMAARGEREMPPELPGVDSSGSTDSTSDSTSTLERTLTIDGTDAGWTDYSFTVSDTIENDPDVGSFGDGDSIDGSTASGFVNGGVDGYRFSGEITDATVNGDAVILVDGQPVDPASLEDPNPTVTTGAASDVTATTATLNGSLDALGAADSVDVSFEWREVGASSWTTTAAETLSSTGAFTASVSGLAGETSYEYRAVASASDGDTATGSSVEFTTPAETVLGHTLRIDGTDAGWTDYSFTVSDTIENDPDVGTFGDGDSIDGSTASGFVNGGVDGYLFSGEITDATVDGTATIRVDGEPVDPSTFGSEELSRTVAIDGSNAGQTDYEIAVSGAIENDPDVGSFNDGDTVSGTIASGSVNGGVDGYRFSGEIVGISIDGDAALLVDGEPASPDSLVLPNYLVFDSTTQSETTYEVEVSGEMVNDPLMGVAESSETVENGTATGSVSGDDKDGFRFSGDLVSLRLDGDASVAFEDIDG